MDLSDPAAAQRLVIALCAVGTLLLALEVGLPGNGLAPIGALAFLGGVGLAFYAISVEIGSLLLLGGTTLLSLGFLLVLTYLPKSPLSSRWLLRSARDIAREEAAARAAEQERE